MLGMMRKGKPNGAFFVKKGPKKSFLFFEIQNKKK